MTALESRIEEQQTESMAAGWYDDPQGRHRLRYFNGLAWTSHVTHFGPTPCIGCMHPEN